jgi:hypothetical protein
MFSPELTLLRRVEEVKDVLRPSIIHKPGFGHGSTFQTLDDHHKILP